MSATLVPDDSAAPPVAPIVEPPAVPNGTPAIVERSIPAEVSAAWELELLIAGAVTFALFQLPSSLDALRDAATGRFATIGATIVITLAYVYAKAVLYVLIVGFVTNLAARAYWVGLVGLHSVYPRGVRWDAVRMGPLATEQYRTRIRSLPSIIARVDNFASVIFSFAFLVVITFVFSVVGFALLGVLAWGIATLLFGGSYTVWITYALAALILVPGMIAVLVDKRIGARLERGSLGWRRLDRALRVFSVLSGTLLFGPIFYTLTSNVGRRRITMILYLVVFGAMGVSMTEWFYRADLIRGGAPAFVPDDPDVAAVNGAHYESLRAPRPGDVAPTIQSDVIDGPYVRLFIPYRDERHDYAIRTGCPGVAPLRTTHVHLIKLSTAPSGDDRAAARVLACLAKVQPVSIDGAPVPNLAFHFYEHPATGAPGMLAYLSTTSLAPGMHTISVPPLPRLPSTRSTRPLVPTVIPFWR